MEDFAVDGSWWLPASPDHRVPGRLTLSTDGLVLVVYGSLVPTISVPGALLQQGPPDWEVTPSILGRSHAGKKVTLLDAEGANLIGPKILRSTYRVRLALTDIETTEDLFTEVQCEFDCLTVWAEPPAIAEPTSEPDGDYLVRFRQLELGRANVGNVEVRLVATPLGVMNEDNGNKVEVEQKAVFRLKLPAAGSREIADAWIRPLQDLLILAFGRTVRLTGLYLRPRGVSPDETFGKASFAAVQPSVSIVPGWSTLMSYTAPTLLTLRDSPVSFGELIPRWFQLRRELHEVLVLLHTQHYADFLFNEHLYSSVFQSAEALADARGFSGREKSRAEHRARVDEIVSAARVSGVSEEAISWAERILRSRNDKPLWRQIHDLVASTGEVGREVFAASPEFGQIAAGARTGVSHGGAAKKLDAAGRFWHADVLRWVIRAKILTDLGLPEDEVERRVLTRGGFTHALAEVRTYAGGAESSVSD